MFKIFEMRAIWDVGCGMWRVGLQNAIYQIEYSFNKKSLKGVEITLRNHFRNPKLPKSNNPASKTQDLVKIKSIQFGFSKKF